MPDSSNIFSGLANDRKLTETELIRAIRFAISSEYEAIQIYTQLAESIDNNLVAEVLNDVAYEEQVHAGEFLKLLFKLCPDEESSYEEGAFEVEKKFGEAS